MEKIKATNRRVISKNNINNENHLFFFCIFIYLLIITACHNNNRIPEIKYQSLTNTGWEILKQDSTSHSGHIKLKNEIWLMNFLHWWPLNENNKNISIAYTKDLLMNLWGMQFTLTGTEGETQVNGHKAFFVEGTFSNIVKTMFIVWNCQKTNRQFVSDCNINISLNTPEDLLNLQVNDITNSVCCHKTEKPTDNPKLRQKIHYEKQNIELNLPSDWHSDFYVVNPNSEKKSPGHYRQGVTEQEGVIWNLLTDSHKEIDLIWQESSGQLSKSTFNDALDSFFNDTIIDWHDTLKLFSYYTNTDLRNISLNKDYFECNGKFNIITEVENYYPIDTSLFQYKAFLWNNEKTNYLLITSMVAHNNIWGIPIDLVPSDEQFDSFINNSVLKNINYHPILIE